MGDFYADVILPLPLNEKFTYRVPDGIDPYSLLNKRVTVSFGRKKSYSALVVTVHTNSPSGYEIKEIESVLDDEPVIFDVNLGLWHWISRYYICPLGDVMKAAMPSGMKLESASVVTVLIQAPEEGFSDRELQLYQCVKERKLSVSEIEKRLGKDFSIRILQRFLDRKILQVEETLSAKYKPKHRMMVSPASDMRYRENWEKMLAGMTRSLKQKEFLMAFAVRMALFSDAEESSVDKSELKKLDGYSEAVFNRLVNKNILVTRQEKMSRLDEHLPVQTDLNLLNEKQKTALDQVKALFRAEKTVLLHGVTASGKTEIYIHLIDEVCRKGMQVLYMVPEISLTPQIITRLRRVFGKAVGVYHSKMGDAGRVEVWNKVLSYTSDPGHSLGVVLGARSALFLPFAKLGLIIVDEEHENSYKQSEPSPRYNARDMAIVMGSQHNCPVLLGSATPSFESYHNVKTGKYGIVRLADRFGNATLPEIVVADVRRAWKRHQMHSMLTPELFEGINRALKLGQQVILFQNRRGFSPYIECMNCGWIPGCETCDVSLTYHRKKNRLICHYCGSSREMTTVCMKCGSADLKARGFGTEKVEDEISLLFPVARISRIDQDTTRSRNAMEKIIGQLENGKTDILIGTQMVTKGLDFDNVSVIGILNADNLLNFPDFRAHERAFQLMMQVSGRSGRKDKKGTVYIQTSQPDHPVIRFIQNNDFEGFFKTSMEERKNFRYPPAYRLIKIVLKLKNELQLKKIALQMAETLRFYSYFAVLGPQSPLVGRVQLWYIREIWLKTGKDQHLARVQDAIMASVEKIRQLPGNSGIMVMVDVDPL